MTAKFHVNPDTGDVRACSAVKKCRFGDNAPHYSTLEEARNAYEQTQGVQVKTLTRKSHTIKSLLTTAFSLRSKPELSQVTKTTETIPKVLDIVTQTEDGRFEVTVYDRHLGLLTHKFGDHLTDPEIVERLHLADPKKKYQLGECGTIAGELWNLSEHVEDYRIIKTESEPVFGTHHFVRLKDGTCVDSQGLWTEQAFIDYWKDVDSTSEISTFDLDDDSEVKNPEFPVSNPELLNLLKDLVNQHVGKTSKHSLG